MADSDKCSVDDQDLESASQAETVSLARGTGTIFLQTVSLARGTNTFSLQRGYPVAKSGETPFIKFGCSLFYPEAATLS